MDETPAPPSEFSPLMRRLGALGLLLVGLATFACCAAALHPERFRWLPPWFVEFFDPHPLWPFRGLVTGLIAAGFGLLGLLFDGVD